jgi:phage baseplate assembly protein V
MSDIQRLLQNLIAFGTVTETKVAAGKMLARVKVDDDRVTDFFPMLSKNNSFTKKATPIRVGEQVVVLCPGGEGNIGVILGSIYNVNNKEPEGFSDTREIITYEDGTIIFYDSESKTLDINAVGLINIVCKEAKVKADTTYIESTSTHKGDVTIEGNLLVKQLIAGQNGITISGGTAVGGASFDCDISAKNISVANITSSGDIRDRRGNLTNHSNNGYSRD